MTNTIDMKQKIISKRLRGFLPVVVDVETGGLNPRKDALLELAAIVMTMDSSGLFSATPYKSYHIIPFEGGNLDPEALALNKIDPYHPFRFAISEKDALKDLFEHIQQALTETRCQRAVLVGHNAWFDLSVLKEASKRCQFEKMPFHSFTTLDTASLGALAYGQTVLARACQVAKINFERTEAHSAVYDAQKTAELFCKVFNRWEILKKTHDT